MVEPSDPIVLVGSGAFLLGAIIFYSLGKWRGKAISKGKLKAELDKEQSLSAHEDAVERAPPVTIGDTVTVGIKEFQSHHSGKERAVCKKEGFVIFVEECPASASVGDRIDAKITSYGKNKTSAEAVYVS